MKFPSEYTSHFAISIADNGYVLYYQDSLNEGLLDEKKITKNRVYPETVEGKKELFEDLIEILEWYPSKRKDGITIAITKQEVF